MTNLQINELSERELDILKLVATGASNKEIAQKLFISSNTVKVHLRNIFAKINATSRTEAAMYAVRIGLVENASTPTNKQDEVLTNSSNAGLLVDETAILPVDNKRSSRIRALQYIGFSLGLLIFLVLGALYIRRSVLPVNTPIPSTPTPRVQWFEVSGLSVPRQGLAAVSYENSIYAISGSDALGVSNIVEKYDPKSDQWTQQANKPTAVTEINAATLGGLIYVPGGRLASGLPTDITEVYDPEHNTWSVGVSLPKALSAYSLGVYEGKMYLFGGWDGTKVSDTVFVFDPHDNSWSEATPMKTPRSSAGIAVIGSRIYIIGGWDGDKSIAGCEIFRPDLDGSGKEWIDATSLPFGRSGMGATNLADMVFVVGGSESPNDPSTIVLLPGAAEWSKIDSPVPTVWTKLNTVVIGSRLYALGGSTPEGLASKMWSYQAIYTITLPIIR